MDSASELDTDELFFQQGEEGTYLGGPTRHPSLAPVELELEVAPFDSDQLARAGRFRRPVALLVSSLGVMFLLALALHRPAAESYAVAADDAPSLRAAAVSEATPPAAVVAPLEAPLAQPFITSPPEPLPAQSANVIVTEPITAQPVATEPVAAEPAAAEPVRTVQHPPVNRAPTSRASTLKPRPATSIALTPSAMTLKSRTVAPSAAQQAPRLVPAARFPDYKP
jgi:hypothetical protein